MLIRRQILAAGASAILLSGYATAAPIPSKLVEAAEKSSSGKVNTDGANKGGQKTARRQPPAVAYHTAARLGGLTLQ